jgi:ankyrin repeat protein
MRLGLSASARAGFAWLLTAGAMLTATDLRLVDAIKRRDHKAVTALLAQHADVNAAQPDGATALSWALYLDDRESAELLLAAGANIKTADEYGETPLSLAAANGDAALVQRLLKAGADPNAARWDGETTLMIAAEAGSVEVVEMLIAQGADVNAVESRKGQTALMWAASEGHADVVRALIQHKAEVNAASKSGFTALVFAAIKNDPKSVQELLASGADPDFVLPDGTKVLLVAAAYKSGLAAAALVDGGANPNVADRGGNTPLHTAAQLGNVALVEKLLSKGANPNARTARNEFAGRGGGGGGFRLVAGEQTPLLVAARANRPDAARALVAGGADPKLKAQDGTTLLMAAAGSGHVEMARYAYELDSNVKAVTGTGSTVMHAAVTGTMANSTQAEICKVIQFLADKGAPLDELDSRGRTPINVADTLPIDKAVELLTDLIVKSGATPRNPSKR